MSVARPNTNNSIVKSIGPLLLLLLVGLPVNERGLRLFADETAAPKIKFLKQWGQKGDKPGEFHFPIGIAVNSADQLFVVDHLNHRVQKFEVAR